ncbi:MAG TPA: class II aldolase/adducin family protein, partial [Roseiarcus sp.]|nr:class II aldolase/adducin family protein [Roseiarcus sp.]
MASSTASRRTGLARLVGELVEANHILFHQNVLDGFGHVSARHPLRPDRFLLSRSMAPALVRASDVMEFDLDANPTTPDGRPVYLERFIHGEIYRARSDVSAVVHSHSPSLIPFGVVSSARLRPVCHTCGFLG